MSSPLKFAVGGPVQAMGGIYLLRQADEDLLVLCRTGAFVYILTTRQVGKSSLMYRTVDQLAEENVRSVVIDLTKLGVTATPEQWYLGLLKEVEEQLELKTKVLDWWDSHERLPMIRRLILFFEEVVLVETATPIVIFVDEIDSTRSLSFTDDFYAAIRYMYGARANSPIFQRLSFVLCGVATPNDLIQDPKRTPFNIGQRVELTDFTFDETLPLAPGLNVPDGEAHQVLRWVLDWTGGHPYLTLRLCEEIAKQNRGGWTEADIDELVAKVFLRSKDDKNIEFVRDMLTRRVEEDKQVNLESVLTTYRAIYLNKTPVPDEEQSLIKSHLKLAGVVRRENGSLVIRNRIYREAFNASWISDHLPVNWARRLTRAAAVLILTLLVLSVPLAVYAWNKKDEAEASASRATEALKKETDARQQAQMALEREEIANKEAQKSLENEKQAKEKLQVALRNEQQAKQQVEEQRVLAERRRVEAQRLAASEAAAKREALAAAQQVILLNQQLNQTNIQLKDTVEAERAARRDADKARDAARMSEVTAVEERGRALAAQQEAEKEKIEAQQARDEAERLRKTAFARQLGAKGDLIISQNPSIIQTGVLLAIGSLSFEPNLEGDQALRRGLYSLPRPLNRPASRARFSQVNARPITFSPDGKLLATGAGDKVIVLDMSNTLAGAPDAAGTEPGRGTLSRPPERSSGRQQPLFTLSHTAVVTDLVFSPSRRLIATSSEDGTAALWDAATGLKIHQYRLTDDVRAVAFSPDERFLYIAGDQHEVKEVDITTGEEVRTLVSSTSPGNVRGLAVNNDGRFLATASQDRAIIFDLSKGSELFYFNYGEGIDINSIAFAPGGRSVLATGGEDGTARIYSLDDKSEVVKVRHNGEVRAVTFSPDGRFLATASDDGSVRLWNAADGKLIARIPIGGRPADLSFTPDGQFLAATNFNALEIFDITRRQDQAARPEEVALSHNDTVRAVAFSPDEQYVATATSDKTASVWGVGTGERRLSLVGHDAGINSIAYSDDGRFIVTSSQDQTARVWDAQTGASVILSGHTGAVNSATFSRDGKYVVTAGADKTARVWEWETQLGRADPMVLAGHTESINSAVFSPAGLIATAGDDNKIILWKFDAASNSGSIVTHLAPPPNAERQTSAVRAVAFNKDGTLLASAGLDGIVGLWRIVEGQPPAALKPMLHDSGVTSVAFSPDGKYLASASLDRTARVWDLSNGREVSRVTHTNTITAVVFSGNSPSQGRYLATGSLDKTAKVWLWRPGDLVEDACSRLTSDLSEKEWRQYFEEEPYRRLCTNLPSGN